MKTLYYHFAGTLTAATPLRSLTLVSNPQVISKKILSIGVNHSVTNTTTGLDICLSSLTPFKFWISNFGAAFNPNVFENMVGADIATYQAAVLRLSAAKENNVFNFKNLTIPNPFNFFCTWNKGVFANDLSYITSIIFEIEEKKFFL